MSPGLRAVLVAAGVLTSVVLATAVAAQPNPYERVEAPSPPAHLNDGRWGELIQVRVGPSGNITSRQITSCSIINNLLNY